MTRISLEPDFYIAKLGRAGVYTFFLIFAFTPYLLLILHRRLELTRIHKSMFEQNLKKSTENVQV